MKNLGGILMEEHHFKKARKGNILKPFHQGDKIQLLLFLLYQSSRQLGNEEFPIYELFRLYNR